MIQKPQVQFNCGIDLGTTFSCIAVGKEKDDGSKRIVVDVIENNGKRTTPSWVAFKADKIHVGETAKNQATSNKKNTIFDAKRIIGHKIDDESVQNDIKTWPFKVVDDGNKNPLFEVEYQGKAQRFSPQQISSFILKHMVDAALPKVLGSSYDEEITKNVIITVPAYFTESQRRATIEAGALAGLNVIRVINEPTAAAIAYGYNNKKDKENRTILVYDFGGGTFDVSIIKVVGNETNVIATDGNDHLGGEDVTNRLVEYFCHETGINIESTPQLIPRIKKQCEEAKIQLSNVNDCDISIEVEGEEKKLSVSRAKLNDICKDIYSKTIEIVEAAMKRKSISKKDIDDIVLVGGSSRIPIIEDLLKEYFPEKNINKDINPDEAVATGAALLAEDILKGTFQHSFNNGSVVIVDVKNNEVLGTVNNIKPPPEEVKTDSDGAVIVKNPLSGKKSIISKPPLHNEPPPLAPPPPIPLPVPILEDYPSETLTSSGFKPPVKPSVSSTLIIKDVLSHSIGVNLHGDKYSVILEKNVKIPCDNKRDGYKPHRNGQTKIVMKFLEGEDPVASHNKTIRSYTIDNLPTDRDFNDFNFTYTMSLNENGILTFSYKEASDIVPEGTLTIGNI